MHNMFNCILLIVLLIKSGGIGQFQKLFLISSNTKDITEPDLPNMIINNNTVKHTKCYGNQTS